MDVPFIEGFFTNSRGQRYGPLVRKKKLKVAGNSTVNRTPYDTSSKSGARNVTGGIRQKTDDYLSSIEKRANMPRKPTRPRRLPAGKRPRSLPTLRRSTKKRKLKRKAPRRVKKRKIASIKYHNHRYEQEGSANASTPYMYVGLNDCYSRGAIWDAMADALLRPILAKEWKFFPLQDTDTIGNLSGYAAQMLVFDFKRVNGINGTATTFTPFTATPSDANLALCRLDVDNVTYDTMRTRMSTIMQYFADGVNTATPAADSVAYFPSAYHTSTNASTSASNVLQSLTSSFDHLGDTSIDLRFGQKTMFSNRTLAQGGGAPGEFTDRLGVNPLKGKLYQLNHAAPRILDHVDMSAALKTSIQSDPAAGMAKYTSASSQDLHLAHPLGAKFWLKNCVKETTFMIKPGGLLTHSTTKEIKGKLSSLIERFYFSGFDKGTFGQSTLFMFDMVHITDQTPAVTYKRHCVVKSAGKLKTPKLYIPDFEAVIADL